MQVRVLNLLPWFPPRGCVCAHLRIRVSFVRSAVDWLNEFGLKGKITGAGGGGSVVALLPPGRAACCLVRSCSAPRVLFLSHGVCAVSLRATVHRAWLPLCRARFRLRRLRTASNSRSSLTGHAAEKRIGELQKQLGSVNMDAFQVQCGGPGLVIEVR
jgi:hypothetical protein